MAQANVPFDKRLKRIVRRHDKMSNGVVRTVQSDGLIVARPRMYTPRFPLKGLVVLLVVGFVFKGLLLSYLGEAAYSERVTSLQQGTFVEQTAAWIMQEDPASTFIAKTVQPFLQ